MTNTIIYTDGSALAKNVNLGGWAFCKINQSNDIELRYGTSDNSDSNSMELLAVIKALESVESKGRIKIISDSQYVIHGVETKFKQKKVKKENTKDIELWSQLESIVKNKSIIWEWVRAHQKNEINNYIDSIARASYSDKDKINTLEIELIDIIRNKTQKVQVGDLIWIKSKSQKYVVVVNDIIVGNKLGFLVKMLANRYGREYSFIEKNASFSLVERKTNKEIHLITEIIKSFKE